MAKDPDEHARRKRADELRKRVQRLLSGEPPEDGKKRTETPREFIHRRMGEHDAE
jgi:hypothetical protein